MTKRHTSPLAGDGFDERFRELVAMLVRMGFASHDAEDAVQNAALVSLRHDRGGGSRLVSKPEAWLRVVAVRAACRAARKRLACDPAAVQGLTAPPADDVERRDEAEAVCRAVQRLPERLRGAVILCALEGHTYHEAARRLGVSVGEVGRRLLLAREELWAGLRGRGFDPAGVA